MLSRVITRFPNVQLQHRLLQFYMVCVEVLVPQNLERRSGICPKDMQTLAQGRRHPGPCGLPAQLWGTARVPRGAGLEAQELPRGREMREEGAVGVAWAATCAEHPASAGSGLAKLLLPEGLGSLPAAPGALEPRLLCGSAVCRRPRPQPGSGRWQGLAAGPVTLSPSALAAVGAGPLSVCLPP